ncbi:MAG: SPOR domain-containing protein, partial [Giesbergeria sp.]
MLRLTVIVLLLANAGYYAWSQGHLAEWGLAPAPQGEPQRLQQQIRPEAVRLAGEPVRPPARPAPVAAPVPEPSAAQASAEAPPASVPVAATEPARPAGECLQAGVFD